jgi:hypothetical protein
LDFKDLLPRWGSHRPQQIAPYASAGLQIFKIGVLFENFDGILYNTAHGWSFYPTDLRSSLQMAVVVYFAIRHTTEKRMIG